MLKSPSGRIFFGYIRSFFFFEGIAFSILPYEKDKAAIPEWEEPPCYKISQKRECALGEGNSLVGAYISAGAALGAGVSVNRILVALRDCARGTLIDTSTASDTIVTNYVSHNVLYLEFIMFLVKDQRADTYFLSVQR